MATPFSKEERALIDKNLRKAAKDCLGRYGVRKTTVDELVTMAGISKGSFYNFYPGKEILFFQVLEEYQEKLFAEFLANLEKPLGTEEITEALYQLYQRVRKSFIMTIIQQGELDYLIRKIPSDLLENHHSFDALLAEKLFALISLKPEVKQETILTALRALFISLIYVDAVGKKHYDEALKLLIKGVVLQVCEGA